MKHSIQIDVAAAELNRGAPMTLRRMIELFGEEFMDVPLTVSVKGGKQAETIHLTEDWFTRAAPNPDAQPGDTFSRNGYLHIPATLRKHVLVNRRT